MSRGDGVPSTLGRCEPIVRGKELERKLSPGDWQGSRSEVIPIFLAPLTATDDGGEGAMSMSRAVSFLTSAPSEDAFIPRKLRTHRDNTNLVYLRVPLKDKAQTDRSQKTSPSII